MKSWTVPLDIDEPTQEDLIPNFKTSTTSRVPKVKASKKASKLKRKISKASRKRNRK